MSQPNPNSDKPQWLSELQLKSWEPEILLSGIVLYGMFQVPGLLDELLAYAKLNIWGNFTDLDNMIALLKIALYWLILGLILHLISRGIWVGMVGLSFTFPYGINKEKLKLSPRFQKKAERIPPIQQIIINLEKLCSSLFSISFMMFMIVIGGYLFILITLIIPVISFILFLGPQNVTESHELVVKLYAYCMLGIAFVALFDFVTLGLLKRFSWLSRVYYPLHKYVSALSLARFYRPIYFTLITNYNRWKIGIFLVFFVFGSVFMMGKIANSSAIPGEGWTRLIFWSNTQNVASFSGNYDDQNDQFHSVQAHIQSDIISENTLRLFTVLKIDLEDSIRKNCNYDSLIQLDTGRHYVQLRCAADFYQVLLDDQKVDSVDWLFHYKQKTNQRGLLTYLDITDLPKGMHTVTIRGPEDMYPSRKFAVIPFYREFSPDGYFAAPTGKAKEEDPSYLRLKPILPK